jgi:hypothetical protein
MCILSSGLPYIAFTFTFDDGVLGGENGALVLGGVVRLFFLYLLHVWKCSCSPDALSLSSIF